MSGTRREKFERFLDSGGPWKNPLPTALRIAAELHFGTLILFAVLATARKGIGAGAGGLFSAGLAWTVTHVRGANSPASWWITVVGFTILGIFMCIVAVAAE